MFAIPQEAVQKIDRNVQLRVLLEKGGIKIKLLSALDKEQEVFPLLLELRTLFQKQLPKMPKEYITRLLFDIKHHTMALLDGERPEISRESRLLGGICFRPFFEQHFVEIVFCAVGGDSQIKGYGEFMMNMLKETVREEFKKHFSATQIKYPIYLLTYADNYAIGYFKKQGFTKRITFKHWRGRIKDYEGGTLMQGKIIPEMNYHDTYSFLVARREVLLSMLQKEHPEIYREYTAPKQKVKTPEDLPGVKEAGFTEEMKKMLNTKASLKEVLLYLCSELQNHKMAWPFLEPVNGNDVKDYYTTIKRPMDLSTIQNKILQGKYANFVEMDADVQLMINNCYIYNAPGTQYTKCAKSLNEFYQSKVKWCREALVRREEGEKTMQEIVW